MEAVLPTAEQIAERVRQAEEEFKLTRKAAGKDLWLAFLQDSVAGTMNFLTDLYDPLTMPPELRKAHQANDKAFL